MTEPYLALASDPPLILRGIGDETSGLCYPILRGIGAIHRPADGSETGNVTIDLDNSDGTATALLAIPPLRQAALLYGPDGSVWFEGILAGVKLGESASLELEA